MARKTKSDPPMRRSARETRTTGSSAPLRWMRRWLFRVVLISAIVLVGVVATHGVIDPPRGVYMKQEARRLGAIEHQWVAMEAVTPLVARSIVAAEDANFCEHWGFDMTAIRAALDEGSGRGASTLSQQAVKNVYLWHGRSWLRKALEAGITPILETFWSKRRIVEVYMNVAEFDEGVFGVHAAAWHYFDVSPADLSPTQAARLAMVLPNPKGRSASRPTDSQRKRTAGIMDGAATIHRDGRAACFED